MTARLCSDGWSVAGLDHNGVGLRETLAELELAGGGAVIALEADVSDPRQVRAAVEAVGRATDGLHAVVNAAGIGGYSGDVAETTIEHWEHTIAVNLSGVFYVCREALGLLRSSPASRIVNVSSQYGLVGGAGSPAYAAAKAGVIGLSRAMAVDHAGEGILVNCICPGPIDTPMLQASAGAGDRAAREKTRSAGRCLLGGPGRPEDVAGAVAFLLGPDSLYMTGAVIAVDGGWTAA